MRTLMSSAGKISIHKQGIAAYRNTHTESVRGFTLLELLVVLVLVSLISVLAGPKIMASLTRLNLKNTAKQISASLRYARSQAASQKILFLSAFDIEGDALYIFPQEKPFRDHSIKEIIDEKIENNEEIKRVKLPETVKLEKTVTSTDEEMDSGWFVVSFFSKGNSSGGEVFLMDEKERRYKVVVDTITGSVKVAEVEDD
jgi:prepilin-type N-terminal cleavage/methylation domain-containing protein